MIEKTKQVRAEVQEEVQAEDALDKALATKPNAERRNDGTLRMYLVLKGKDAQVVREYLVALGANGNYAAFLKVAVLNELKHQREGLSPERKEELKRRIANILQ
jgi:hypothetical protein